MPTKVYDDDGNEFEMPTKEEKEVLDKEREEAKTQLEEANKELKGLRDKKFNFKKLRDMSEEEKGKFDEKELALKQQIEEMQEGQESNKNKLEDNWKDKAIRSMVGSDEEMKKKILENYDALNIDAGTEYEIGDKMTKAYQLAYPGQTSPSPFNTPNYGKTEAPEGGKANQSKASKAFGDKLGVSTEDRKKYKKGVKLV